MTLEELSDIVSFVDPASGRKSAGQRKNSSRSADVVVGTDDLGRIFVLHAWAGRVPTTVHTDRIFQLVRTWRPRIVGIDASAMQTLYADSLMREAKVKHERLPLWPMQMPPNVEKTNRIRAVLQPVLGFGRLFLRADQRELAQEIEAFPTGATLDLVDSLTQAITLLRKTSRARSEANERDAYVEYLRSTKAPAAYVDAVKRASGQDFLLDTGRSFSRRSG